MLKYIHEVIMKKFLTLAYILALSVSSAFAADMRFVQISDVRFDFNGNPDLFREVIKDVNKQKGVEFVVFTGDNINKPTKEDLQGFIAEAKKLNAPFYIVLGDKDVNKLKQMSKEDYLKIVNKNYKKYKYTDTNYVFEKNKVVFIVADGSKEVIPTLNGYYKEPVVDFVEKNLNLYQNNNVIIFQHFPLIPPSNREAYYTFKPENYLKTLASHKNVKAVISGHFGVNSEQEINGVQHITTSGLPYYRVIDVMDYETSSPTIWAELRSLGVE